MAEKIISPGVFTNEIDQTFLPAAVADIGAAIIGPTLKGPAGIPTVVTSFSDFQAKFGDVFKSGSDSYQFLTSHAAEEYLKNSDTLTVVRILADGGTGVSAASASVVADGLTATAGTFASGTLTITDGTDLLNEEVTIGGVDFTFVTDNSNFTNTTTQIFVTSGALATSAGNLRDAINNNVVTHGLNISASSAAGVITISGSSAGTGANLSAASSSVGFTFDGDLTKAVEGGTDGDSANSFVLETLSHGSIMNNAETTGNTNNILRSGSKHNIRYEVSNVNTSRGTFTLLIRAGNDNQKRKQTLETFNNCSLDPNSTNYISKLVGDQRQTVQTDNGVKYLQLTGSYPNQSRFVRVSSVDSPTIDYLDENGNVRLNSLSSSLPAAGSGSSNGGFAGGLDGHSGFDSLGNQNGDTGVTGGTNFYDAITDSNSQGLDPTTADDGMDAYTTALDLLANQDEFDVNLILMPGIIGAEHATVTAKAIDVCEDRGDCFTIIDPVVYGSTLGASTTQAATRDSNFAAMYWPWVKVPDSQLAGTQRWVPPSVVMGGVYAFNDRVAHPWFAPAGLNRGGITTAIQAERKLTQGNRDDLYDNNVNPIATFPGQGVTVFGQKTLQKKSSALDRINVRRLLIRVKKFVASSSRFLVFEQNTAATRRRFLGIVNPFLEQVQSQSGLSAFRVVMDETNNTPDTIDRNQLVGQLFLQPTRTAEFIVLDFTIQPTGASFPE
jgi:hypothetical protein